MGGVRNQAAVRKRIRKSAGVAHTVAGIASFISLSRIPATSKRAGMAPVSDAPRSKGDADNQSAHDGPIQLHAGHGPIL